jgi:cyclopropane fatty-acyl-phospholipid synthase-like methyltransferase
MYTEIQQCRICGNADLVPVLNLGTQYLTGVFPSGPDQQLTCGPLELIRCNIGDPRRHCGLVQLRQTYQLSEMYGQNYGYRSGLNRAMVSHLHEIVEHVRQLVPTASGDLVLDIGSNDGTLLSHYPAGGPTLCGIDPTAAKFRRYYREDIRVIPDFFSAELVRRRFGDQRARIITSIAMFYDLQRPLEFVRQIRDLLADDGVWLLEQSYLPAMLRANAYDTICHEHLEYYSLRQIEWLMNQSDMKVVDVTENDANGGSFAVTVARAESRFTPNVERIAAMTAAEEEVGFDTSRPFEAFRQRTFAHRDKLVALLSDVRRSGQTVLGYGASTKGNVILQFCGITAELLPAIAEVNPDKFGRVTPGSLIPILSEAEAHARKPDYLLAFPWHFRETLVQRESEFLRQGGKMIFPLPEIEVVEATQA